MLAKKLSRPLITEDRATLSLNGDGSSKNDLIAQLQRHNLKLKSVDREILKFYATNASLGARRDRLESSLAKEISREIASMPGTLGNTVENSLERAEQQSTPLNRSILPSRFHKKENGLTLQQTLD